MSKLTEQMKADLQLKGFKPNTQRTYLIEVGNLARYFDKSPEELGKEEVKEYLLHLMNDKKLSQGTFKSYVSGIKFLYKTTLNRHEVVDDIKVPSSKNFFIHVEVLSKLFKYKFLDYLKTCFETGALIFPGGISHLVEPRAFERFRSAFYYKKWVVYCKPPFSSAEGVLQYLGRYTHRIAISNNRIVEVKDGKVSFRWRDYADGDKQKVMPLQAEEFIRRFLLHVLPPRFVRIRHFGLLANRSRKDNISVCRELLGACKTVTNDKETPETWQEQLLRICGIDVTTCPVCKKGKMRRIEVLLPRRCNDPPEQC
jgi:hypothetical protein